MVGQFTPKNFLRQTANVLLREFFASHDALCDFPWSDTLEHQVEPIFKAWQELPPRKRTEIEHAFEAVEELASEKGLRCIFEEATYHDVDLQNELSRFLNKRDRLLFVAMEHPKLFDIALTFHRAHALPKRHLKRRTNMPEAEPDVSAEALDQFRGALSAHYQNAEGRGHRCHVEHYLRLDRYHYFFAYLDDYADTYMGHNELDEFVRHPHRPAFEVVFIYDPVDCTLEHFARGDRKHHITLQEIFCERILGEHLPYELEQGHSYDLNVIKSREFLQQTRALDVEDQIELVQVRKVRLAFKDGSGQRILLEANPEGEAYEIYQMLEDRLNRSNLSDDQFHISFAQFHFRFRKPATGRQKTMTFELTFPNSSNLNGCNEDLRPIAEKYLKRWKIDRSDALRVVESSDEDVTDADYTLEDVLGVRAS